MANINGLKMANIELMMPQEIEVRYVIPAIRREMAKEMKKANKSQKETAELLNLRESTVSQYINDKRGKQIILNKEIKKMVKDSIKNIKTRLNSYKEIQKILKKIRMSREICSIHKQIGKSGCRCFPDEKGCIY